MLASLSQTITVITATHNCATRTRQGLRNYNYGHYVHAILEIISSVVILLICMLTCYFVDPDEEGMELPAALHNSARPPANLVLEQYAPVVIKDSNGDTLIFQMFRPPPFRHRGVLPSEMCCHAKVNLSISATEQPI